jgi:hypothetical protein
VCLLFSLVLVLGNLYYSHHFLEREVAEAQKKKFETEVEGIPKLHVVNLRTQQELADFRAPRLEATRLCGQTAKWHENREKRYSRLWRWAARIACLGFFVGIGMLLWFAILNR